MIKVSYLKRTTLICLGATSAIKFVFSSEILRALWYSHDEGDDGDDDDVDDCDGDGSSDKESKC